VASLGSSLASYVFIWAQLLLLFIDDENIPEVSAPEFLR
jgi:hypothetical protein